MPDVTLTAANVIASGTDTESVTWGETITAGQLVYKKAADSKHYKASTATADESKVAGVALNGGAAGQPGKILKSGDITIGGTLVTGTVYAVSDTAGGIRPVADNGAADFVTTVGVAKSTTVLALNIQASGVQVPA